MGTERTLSIVTTSTAVSTAAALEEFLRWLAGHRGRSGRVTSPETVRSYLSALPVAFAGITDVAALDTDAGRARLQANIRTALGE
ncbi:hypothetical protein [Nocardia stercoris]|uniref:Core-binding (CB) domain-containing protein n=1 Tax=Nocardia stercoris TaxID=2483361 RepID=A0A3M2KQ34_9NOCA|nr:hypothetical protein [Nocardia stercoris]RMI27579.1 hypothetical protein EBN03_33485 [Nocardia stercoris]